MVEKLGMIIIQGIEKRGMIVIGVEDYPLTTNPNFNSLLTAYTDFNIKGKIYRPTSQEEVERIANKLCNSDIELTTYQTVVRNFLSNETPYNGLLLFHGLGTGKTCTAITIAEEHRKFLKQSGLVVKVGNKYHDKKIYVLGGPNIKSNFRKQLFDESQLHKGKEWNCKSCVGNSFLREINPTHLDISKEDLVKKVNDIIKRYYKFMGYIEFANKIMDMKKKHQSIAEEFEHSMIIIDEVHNIKEDHVETSPSKALDYITEHTSLKLLLLSATPMFNDVSEIVWISNLLSRNDKKPLIVEKDFFIDGTLVEERKEDFIHHLRGYVSFVKGENPYTFPYRVYPKSSVSLPTLTVHGKEIKPMRTPVYPIQMSQPQTQLYVKEYENNFPLMKFSANNLLGVLNMTYPGGKIKANAYMDVNQGTYSYYPASERCFDLDKLREYSPKIHTICKQIQNSSGIVLIYTRMIDMGVIPMALALESMGFKNIHKDLMKTSKKKETYCLITGSHHLSPHNEDDIARINADDNKNGEKIKVVVITESASEGVDFKNIRQIHIMDPWWHLNRNEQIIGRGIRLCSHKRLPFEKRNAQIFLYVSVMAPLSIQPSWASTDAPLNEVEVIDHYFYRYAEKKAEKIGKITRLIKQNAVDCVMNHAQFKSVDKINLSVNQELSDGTLIRYPIGDNSFSVMCDFMRCEYKCSYQEYPISVESKIFDTNRTIEKIKKLFKHGYIYSKKDLFTELNMQSPVSYHELYAALSQLVELKTECKDLLNRPGYIVNYGVYYMFQPLPLKGDLLGYERRVPMNNNPYSIVIKPLPPVVNVDAKTLLETLEEKYRRATLSFEKSIEEDWYSTIPRVKKHMTESLKKIGVNLDDTLFNQCIVDNLIELLLYPECYELLQVENERIDSYFGKSKHLRLWNDTKIVHLEKRDKWIVVEKVNKKPAELALGEVVGGIANVNSDTRMFKSKGMTEKPPSGISYGQICERVSKRDVNEPRINHIITMNYSNNTNKEICCELEMLLRYLDKIKYNKKRWFLNAIEVIENDKEVTKSNNKTVVNLLKKMKKD